MGQSFFVRTDGSPRPIPELHDQQLMLLTWMRFYSWLFSGKGPEIPDDEVLEDDEKLDQYLADWRQEKEQEVKDMNRERNKHKTKGSSSTGRHNSVSIG